MRKKKNTQCPKWPVPPGSVPSYSAAPISPKAAPKAGSGAKHSHPKEISNSQSSLTPPTSPSRQNNARQQLQKRSRAAPQSRLPRQGGSGAAGHGRTTAPSRHRWAGAGAAAGLTPSHRSQSSAQGKMSTNTAACGTRDIGDRAGHWR